MTTSRNDAHIRKKGGLRMAAAAASAAAFAFALLCFPGIAGAGVTQGLSSCVNTLIPSLFPFMVLSTYMAESGLAASLGKWAQPVTRFLFRQPGCAAAVVLMGFVGGYPAGAKTVSRLLEQGELTREQAGRLLCFCVSAGPPFVLTAVGACLLGNPSAGVVLLLSVTLSGLLLGVFTRFRGSAQPPQKAKGTVQTSGSPFVSSVMGAARSMAAMCALVVGFSVLLQFLEDLGVVRSIARFLILRGFYPGNGISLLPFLAEITAGCRTGAMAGASLPLFAFALGWGGVCVHLQVFSLFREFPVSRWVFRLFRLLHGLLSGALCWLLLPFFPQAESASSQWSSQLSAAASAPIPAVIVLFVLLLVMALDGSRFSLFGRKKSPAGHDA